MPSFKAILVPTDFSELSAKAFHLACSQARDCEAILYLLHISTAFDAYKGERAWSEHSSQYLNDQWKKLEDLQCPGIDIRRSLEEGEPAEQIVRAQKTFGCDLIIMGSYDRSGWTRMIMGSVVDEVLRDANCPVFVVKENTVEADMLKLMSETVQSS